MENQRSSLTVEEVFYAVSSVALHVLSDEREQGEAKLLAWENEARPGYTFALLHIISEGASVNEVGPGAG